MSLRNVIEPRVVASIAMSVGILWLAHSSTAYSEDIPAEKRAAAYAETEKLLKPIVPQSDHPKTTETVLDGERYVLWGELFGDSRIYALSPASSGENFAENLVLSEWQKGQWKPKDAWRFLNGLEWRPLGTPRDDGKHSPWALPEKPFHLADLKGDGLMELLVESWEQYHHDTFILKYDRKSSNLRMLNIGCNRSLYSQDGCLVLESGDNRRFTHHKLAYYKWKGDDPVLWVDISYFLPHNDPNWSAHVTIIDAATGKIREYELAGVHVTEKRITRFKIGDDAGHEINARFYWNDDIDSDRNMDLDTDKTTVALRFLFGKLTPLTDKLLSTSGGPYLWTIDKPETLKKVEGSLLKIAFEGDPTLKTILEKSTDQKLPVHQPSKRE